MFFLIVPVCSLLCLTLPGSGQIKTPVAEVPESEVPNAA